MKKNLTKKHPEKEPTTRELKTDIHDVLVAVGKFADHVEKRFDAVDKRFDAVDKRFDAVEEDVAYLKRNAITKTYLDEKIGALRGDITDLVYKEDRKFVALVHLLEDKDILSEEDAVSILCMPPFPLGQHAG